MIIVTTIVITIIVIIIIYYYFCCYYFCYHHQHDAGSVAAFHQGRQVIPGSAPLASQGGSIRQQQQQSNSKAGVRQAGTTGSKAPLPSAELPYHRFKAGESILISNSKGQEVRWWCCGAAKHACFALVPAWLTYWTIAYRFFWLRWAHPPLPPSPPAPLPPALAPFMHAPSFFVPLLCMPYFSSHFHTAVSALITNDVYHFTLLSHFFTIQWS